MPFAYSYIRLFVAAWLFMGGVAVQFTPSAAATARDDRWRERQLQKIQPEQRTQWIEDRDVIDSNSQAYTRLFGVLIGAASAWRWRLARQHILRLDTADRIGKLSTVRQGYRLAAGVRGKSAVDSGVNLIAAESERCRPQIRTGSRPGACCGSR